MQWIGDDEFVLTCPGGGRHPDVVAALGIDPDAMPRAARKPDPPQEPEQDPKQPELRLVPLAEFAGREETLAESLLGSTENAALTPAARSSPTATAASARQPCCSTRSRTSPPAPTGSSWRSPAH